MRKLYRAKHDLLLGELKDFERDFCVSGENAGLHVLLTDRRGRNEADLERAAYDQDVKVYGMGDFYMEKAKDIPATLILGYGGLSQEEIGEGISLLKKVWC